MIAVPEYRGKGLSREVMEVVELFAMGVYAKNVLIAKIKNDNTFSMRFFEKIGYTFIRDNPHHDEKEYRKTITITQE
jgi:RimJ/RimL family protein N-acetyltransferase